MHFCRISKYRYARPLASFLGSSKTLSKPMSLVTFCGGQPWNGTASSNMTVKPVSTISWKSSSSENASDGMSKWGRGGAAMSFMSRLEATGEAERRTLFVWGKAGGGCIIQPPYHLREESKLISRVVSTRGGVSGTKMPCVPCQPL